MGYILNNMGMGPGPTMKTADYVQRMSDHHSDKIKKHTQVRNQIIGGVPTALHN